MSINKIRIDLKTLPPDVREWVNFEIKISNAHDIAVYIYRRKQVKMDNINCHGYFCDSTNKLVVAGLANDWVGVTVHESCHRDQYIESSSVWNKKIAHEGIKRDPITLFWEWLNGDIDLPKNKLNEVVFHTMNVELDCEKRSAKKIDDFYLPINVKEYIQKANAYCYLYLAIKETKKWYPSGKAPFTLPEIWTKMPTDFDNDYTKIPPKLKKLILKHTFNQ